MLFYKIEFESEKALESGDRQSRRVRSRLKALTADANAKTKGTSAFVVSDLEERKVSIGAALFVDAVSMNRRDLGKAFADFCIQTRLRGKALETREITAGEFSRMLTLADRNDYINDDDDYKKELGMAFIDACTDSECEEALLDSPCTKSEAVAEAKRLLCGASLLPELERIFDRRSPDHFRGNPVHYVIVSDDPQVRRSVRELLLRSLLQRGRLMGRRYCTLTRSVSGGLLECLYEDKLKELYQSQLGCALASQERARPFGAKEQQGRYDEGDMPRLVKQTVLGQNQHAKGQDDKRPKIQRRQAAGTGQGLGGASPQGETG